MRRGTNFPACRALGRRARAAVITALLILTAIPAAMAQTAATSTTTTEAAPDAASQPAQTPPPESSPADAQPAPDTPSAERSAAADPFAADYLSLCAGCHTIGGGPLTGPDLLPSTTWTREDLRVAVERMEKNVGPMTDAQVDGITDLLRKPDLQARLAAASEEQMAEMAATIEPGDPRFGQRLFFGERRFANGGMGCFGCHAVSGRGGNMAVDLTMAHERLGEQSLMSATENPAFPLMVSAYGTRPVTTQEAAHIAAFLKETAAKTTPQRAAQPATEALGLAHAGAAGLFVLVFAAVALLARSRRAGVRARMVRDSFRR